MDGFSGETGTRNEFEAVPVETILGKSQPLDYERDTGGSTFRRETSFENEHLLVLLRLIIGPVKELVNALTRNSEDFADFAIGLALVNEEFCHHKGVFSGARGDFSSEDFTTRFFALFRFGLSHFFAFFG